MKTINYICIVFSMVFIMGCGENFLETEPLTEKTDINYYSTPEEAQEALVGCYEALQLIWSDGVALPLASAVMSDLCFGGTGSGDADDWPKLDEFDVNKETSILNSFEPNWELYYQGIYRCNVLISKLDQIDWTNNENLRDVVEGEAKFLRAFYYFDLIRMFGHIPLLDKPSNENIPQAEPDDVYKLITEDLLTAIEQCSATTYGNIADNQHGHAYKWAAQSLLARVYLFYTGYYNKTDLVGLVTKAQVLENLEDVIANSGYDLVENFADLWIAPSTYEAAVNGNPISKSTYAGETNKEVVFAIKYTYTQNYDGNIDANVWMRMIGLRSTNVAKYGYQQGWGACSVPKEIYESWDDADNRKHASIIAVAEENITFNPSTDKEYTGYYTKKYVSPCDSAGNSIAVTSGGVEWQFAQFQDYACIRFADVLLMAAELGSPDALDYFNRVHTRAGLTEVSGIDKDIIFEERKLEFAFEGIRYWDILRYDHTLAYAASKITYDGTVLNGGDEIAKKIDGSNLIKTKGLCMIPNNQITLSNGLLKQNEGWK